MSKIIKLAQPGFDVKTAGDENLIYSSQWPLLKIYKSGSWKFNNWGEAAPVIVNHDLGYVPAFWFFANTNITSWATSTSTGIDSRSEFNGTVSSFPYATDKALIFDSIHYPPGSSQPIQLQYYIFAIDITKPYQAPIIKSAGIGGSKSQKVTFKVAKPGKDINSKQLGDYSIHSSARSPILHAVYPGITKPDSSAYGNGFVYYHNLGYIPMIFAYIKSFVDTSATTYVDAWAIDQVGGGSLRYTVDEQKIQYSEVNANQEVTLIVLKDPFDLDYRMNINV